MKSIMKKIKKVAVVGGTGKSGQYLVKHLVAQGIPSNVLVRNCQRLQTESPAIEVVVGNIADYETTRTLVKGCSAVISALGLGMPPSEPTIFSTATANIVRAMQGWNVRRYILLTGLQVDTPDDNKGHQTQAATNWMYANYPTSTADRQREYRLLADSNIDWTLVRLPLIEQTEKRSSVQVSLKDCPGERISATNLAHFLIGQLTDDTYHQKAPFVANG